MGMHMVKYGCDLLVPGTLIKSALSQEWIDELHSVNEMHNKNRTKLMRESVSLFVDCKTTSYTFFL